MQLSYPVEVEIPFAEACIGCGEPPGAHISLDCSAGVELGAVGWRTLLWLPAPACERCAARHRRTRRLLTSVALGLPLVVIVASLLAIVALVYREHAAPPSPTVLLPVLVVLLGSVALGVWTFHRSGRFVDRRVLGIEAGHDHRDKWLQGPMVKRVQLATAAEDAWSPPSCPWRPWRALLRVKNLVQGVGLGLVLIGLMLALLPVLELALRVIGGFFGGLGLMMALLPGSAGADSEEMTTAEAFFEDIATAFRGVAWWMWVLYASAGVSGAIGAYAWATSG